MMDQKLELLTEKIEKLISSLERLKNENQQLTTDNGQLKSELLEYKREYDNLKVTSNDKNEGIRTKLTTILNRLEQLEDLAS